MAGVKRARFFAKLKGVSNRQALGYFEDVRKHEAKEKRQRGEEACEESRAAPSTRVYLGFLATRFDFRMTRTKRAPINRNSHGPRDESQMNPNIAF